VRIFAAGAWLLGFLLLAAALAVLRLGRPQERVVVLDPLTLPAGSSEETSDPSGFEESLAIVAPARARAGRPVFVEVVPAEGRVSAVELRVGARTFDPAGSAAGGALRFEIPPQPEGWHPLSAQEAGGPRVEHLLRVGPSVPVEATGASASIPARGLRSNGFEVGEEGSPSSPEVRLVGAAASDPAALASFVQAGGGLLVVGRVALKSLAGLAWFPVAEVLPEIRPEPERASPPDPRESPAPPEGAEGPPAPAPPPVPADVERKEAPSAVVALALLLDRSGSMAGRKLQRAREAAVACGETLSDADFLAVVAFAGEAEMISPLAPASLRSGLSTKLARIGAAGGTRFEPGLRLAFAELEAAPAAIRHVVLLSDGMTEDWNVLDYPDLVRQARARGMTLSTVGIVAPGDRGDEALALLARWGGGRFYPVRDPDEIPQVFTVEARRVRISGEPERREPAPGDPEPSPAEASPEGETPPEVEPTPPPTARAFTVEIADRHDALGEFDPEGLPAVEEYVPVRLAPGGVVPLRIRETGDPLLALRSAGRGWVAVWCGDGGEGAFSGWASEERVGRLWTRIADFVRPPDADVPRWSFEGFGAKGLLRSGGEEPGEIPPPFLEKEETIDAWAWTVRLDPPLRGKIGPIASGRLRSTLSPGEAASRPRSAPPPDAVPSPTPEKPATGSPGLILCALALVLGAEALFRVRRQPSSSSGFRGLRRAGPGGGGEVSASPSEVSRDSPSFSSR